MSPADQRSGFAAEQPPEAIQPVDAHHRQGVAGAPGAPAVVLAKEEVVVDDPDDLSQAAGSDQVPREVKRVVVAEVLIDSQLDTGRMACRSDPVRFLVGIRQRLLDEEGLPGRSKGLYHGFADRSRCADHRNFPARARDHLLYGTEYGRDVPPLRGSLRARRVQVARRHDADPLGVVCVALEVHR